MRKLVSLSFTDVKGFIHVWEAKDERVFDKNDIRDDDEWLFEVVDKMVFGVFDDGSVLSSGFVTLDGYEDFFGIDIEPEEVEERIFYRFGIEHRVDLTMAKCLVKGAFMQPTFEGTEKDAKMYVMEELRRSRVYISAEAVRYLKED